MNTPVISLASLFDRTVFLLGAGASMDAGCLSSKQMLLDLRGSINEAAISGTAKEALIPHLKGPMTLAYSKDHVAAAKVLCDYAKNNDKLEVVCGMMESQFLNSHAVKQLASLPSIDELRGILVGLLQAPASEVARVIQAPPSQLARVLSAYAEKG